MFCLLFRSVAKKAESGVPSGLVNAVEMIVGFDNSSTNPANPASHEYVSW